MGKTFRRRNNDYDDDYDDEYGRYDKTQKLKDRRGERKKKQHERDQYSSAIEIDDDNDRKFYE